MSTNLTFIELTASLRPQMKAVRLGWEMCNRDNIPWNCWGVEYDKQSVPRAYEYRQKTLEHYLDADRGQRCLEYEELTAAMAAGIVGAMLGALGAKNEQEGFVEQVGGFVCAIEDWMEEPDTSATPTTLAMACRSLIRKSKFTPKPVELIEACRTASFRWRWARGFFSNLEHSIRMRDAVLLLFASEKWTEPYYLEDYEDTLKCMLAAHEDSLRWNTKLKDNSVAFNRLIGCARSVFLRSDQIALPKS